ncbi:DEAD/DEAH box helicase family protein [Sinorhizobium mexicanum]|uniref:DEAD/DEAH box helicase n=1 Tax=Sinorhizobium mexicanum TaxID=375549 RepID=A0A859QUV9_9HYPH|nr:DEAD/DEAH box helicase [Sinorhizobium mexicanum]MBP1884983.1 replicative superfamily II helicase [Sinorhizobium mexicanum]QLL64266.1 DEAD/DEAH box helicase [Sinorhizobium mexicanum]
MVDFKKLREDKAKPKPVTPRDIFHSLPKPPGINDLYASQAEALDIWFSRRDEKDLVIKLHTGGGKTLVALLMAQSTMNELGEPVLYLAPTNQLVEQVLAKSAEYGIRAVPYTKGQPLSSDFRDGNAVLVGSYESLFNGRSKFGVRGSGQPGVKVGGIILDDAHVALSSVREAFTLTITAKDHSKVYQELADRFRGSFDEVGRAGAFADITRGKDFGVIEVSSWAWLANVPEVREYLSYEVDAIDPFVWPLLRDNLSTCHCLFSRKSVTITPTFAPVDLLPTFDDAKRRIYMSATIADDSDIVRTFGASPTAIGTPIQSSSLAGVGERMILVPELMPLGEVAITPMVKQIAKWIAAHAGVAILTPSGHIAQQWTDIAEYPETSTAVASRISDMQRGSFKGPVVLANRYDGIDLAGPSCRLLVMDGLPQGTTDYDMFRNQVLADSAVNSMLAQRIEQGIGRGSRGGSDFCVVLLTGANLVAWIGRKKNLDHLTASSRIQLNLGQEVSEAVATTQELGETILKCLNRDADWVAYHASELAAAAQSPSVDQLALKVAGIERRAYRLERVGQFEPAIQALEQLIADPDLLNDNQRKAWLSSLAARIAFQNNDDHKGQRFQTSAFSANSNHIPPRIRPAYIPRPIPGSQSVAIIGRIMEYQRRGSLIPAFNEAVSALVPDASPFRYEEGLANLGNYLGFQAERPEKLHKTGPDVLWRTNGSVDFIIEAKSGKLQDNPLYKSDHAQLLEAEQWFRRTYPGRPSLRVSALPEPVADPKASPQGTFALRLEEIGKLVGAVRNLYSYLIAQQGSREALEERCEAELKRLNLHPEGIKTAYMVQFN